MNYNQIEYIKQKLQKVAGHLALIQNPLFPQECKESLLGAVLIRIRFIENLIVKSLPDAK